ncbi:MAG: cbb3-type cytochrome c oxidase subunit I [Rhodospirillales bacterium]|nr:cbb3-type cytochrome c oxidase subunit I [Rhodospirillales bacterium]
MSTHTTAAGHAPASGWKEWVLTTDHKRIGVLYLIGSMAAFGVAGLMALIIRLEQMELGMQYVASATQYNSFLYFHGAAMVLAFLIPGLTGFAANYFLPLMIGARDVAFPRINAFSIWLFYFAIVLALLSFVIPDAPDIMWTGYPPYSVTTTGNTAFYVFTVHLLGFSSILGAVNFLVTVIYMRAPGMGWNQLNIFVWTTIAAFVLQLIFIPVLAAAVTLLLFDKYMGTHFYDPSAGGDVLLYQNLFWFYSHPAVYVIFLPAVGILMDIMATMCKNRIFNYKAAVYAGIWGIVAIGGIVWIHHLYITGMPDWIRLGHMVTTLLISVPVGILVLSFWGTLYKGAITYNTAMMYAVSCLYLILLGGLTGIPLAIPSMTVHLSETSYVHAHFHFIMALFSAFALFAGIYYWFPKMTGRYADGPIATLSFWLNFIGVNVTFWPLFIIGKEGMPRRYWNYEMFSDMTVFGYTFQQFNTIATYGSWIIAVGMLLQFMNFIKAAISGPVAPLNPWGSKSLEWTHTASPPGPGNFGDTDVVVDENWSPYEYNRG